MPAWSRCPKTARRKFPDKHLLDLLIQEIGGDLERELACLGHGLAKQRKKLGMAARGARSAV
jgi:hypothetical protein